MALRAIILSGGRSSRFGGVHKPGVDLGGRTVISRILAAVRTLDSTADVWVAGPAEGLTDAEAETVHIVREEPAFAGPLAGIAAAVTAIGAGRTGGPADEDITLIIAGDMPMVTAGHLGDLIGVSARTRRPVTGADDRGRAQFLCAAWPHALLRQRLERVGDPGNRAVRLLFADGEPTVIDVDPAVVVDFDTEDELDRIRQRTGRDTPE